MAKKQSKQQQLPAQSIDSDAFDEFRKQYQHDGFCKGKLKKVNTARKFLKYVLKPEVQEVIDLEKLEIEPESFVDKKLRSHYLDILYRVPFKNSNEHLVVFILIELKTSNDRWTIFQIVEYIVCVWKREFEKAKKEKRLRTFLFPMIIPFIFNHGETRFTAPLEMSELVQKIGIEEFESCVLNVKALLFDVPSIKFKNFPDDPELFVPFTMLQAVFSTDVTKRMTKIVQKLQPTIHLPESQEELRDAIYYAITSAKHFSLQDFLKISTQIEKEGIFTMPTSVLDQLVAKRIAEGKAEGEAEGEVKGLRKSVLNVLCKRFKMTNVPKRMKAAIQRMNDPIALESLVVDAAMCQTLDEFAEALN
ncbi:MAG: Rpn family recombination-promoting nuclease/putative transposase [Planctomycetaceae bacterium]|jgi:predicted transposase YdaD|nr:Rpn family recombination-promoting nuclease/putative transposase [Planctomycetaceae bacterium]